MKSAVRVVPAGKVGDDRAAASIYGTGHLLVLADGAGGTAGGAEAADIVLAAALALARQATPFDCIQFLQQIDLQLQIVGETTAVIAVVHDGQISGASVGDSGAWLIEATRTLDLTAQQRHKPLLGSGSAMPVAFGPQPFSGRLLLASDGLLKYVPQQRISGLINDLAVDEAAAALIDAARLPSGALCDDIAVIVAANGATSAPLASSAS